jgi:hypothetical protein
MGKSYTTTTGKTYDCHEQKCEIGFTGKFSTIWVADNFIYYADTYEELCDSLEYWNKQWELEERWR